MFIIKLWLLGRHLDSFMIDNLALIVLLNMTVLRSADPILIVITVAVAVVLLFP